MFLELNVAFFFKPQNVFPNENPFLQANALSLSFVYEDSNWSFFDNVKAAFTINWNAPTNNYQSG